MDVGEGGWTTTDGAGGLGGYEWTNIASLSMDSFGEDGNGGLVVRHANDRAASV